MTFAQDRFLAWDKVLHFAKGWMVAQIAAVFGIGAIVAFLVAVVAAVGWEFVQVLRLRQGKKWESDEFSWRDVVADGIGAVAGLLVQGVV